MYDGEWDYFPRQPRPDWSAWRRPAVLRCDWLVVGGGWLVVTGGWRPRRGWCQDQTAGGSPAERSAPAEMEMAQYYAGGAPGNLNLNHTNNNVISMKVGHSGADVVDRYLAGDMDFKKYVVEHKSGESGHLFEQGKLTNARTTLGPPPPDKN